MEGISRFLFLPLTICLLVMTFSEKVRRRVLLIPAVAAAEKKLSGFERYYWIAFGLTMAAAVFVRCYRFLELPLGVNQDGTMAAVEAYTLLRDGVDQYGTSWPTYFRAWGFAQMSTPYSLLMIPFIAIFGLGKLALRLPMLLVCLLMLPLIWDFARRILGKGYALVVLLVMATNPWNIFASRWALDCNLMPHVLLTAVYLLFIGREKRWALYLSMVVFGLAIYSYGVACFSVPVFLVLSAIYYLARKKANIADLVVCVALFTVIAGPYFYTMAINAFGGETAYLGPITMPLFENSNRAYDMAISQPNPYAAMIWNLLGHAGTYLYGGRIEGYSGLPWTNTMYLFMSPVIICGTYMMWSERRHIALLGKETPFRDAGMLILIWLGSTVFAGSMIGGVVNRNNGIFYSLILIVAWVLYQMSKKLRAAFAVILAMILVSFAGLNVSYFTDEEFQRDVGGIFHDGLHQALTDTWDWDYDRYYVDTIDQITDRLFLRAAVMFAHQIDYSAVNEDTDLIGPDGEPTGWYFTERYIFGGLDDFEPDPMECAVYLVRPENIEQFSAADYLLTNYGPYIVAYPRYWAE